MRRPKDGSLRGRRAASFRGDGPWPRQADAEKDGARAQAEAAKDRGAQAGAQAAEDGGAPDRAASAAPAAVHVTAVPRQAVVQAALFL